MLLYFSGTNSRSHTDATNESRGCLVRNSGGPPDYITDASNECIGPRSENGDRKIV